MKKEKLPKKDIKEPEIPKKEEEGDGKKPNPEEDKKREALENIRKTRVTFIDIDSLAEAEAHKTADNEMSKITGSKNFIKRFWKGNLFKEAYRQKEYVRARSKIEEEGNIYSGRGLDLNAHQEASRAITDRFLSEYKEVIGQDEEKKILDSVNPENKKIISEIEDLVFKYARNEIDELSFANEKNRIFKEINGGGGKEIKMYTDNLKEIASNIGIAIEHGAKMEEIKMNTELISGKAKSSLQTEAHFNKIDKLIDKLKNSKVGRYVNPATMTMAIGLAYSLGVTVAKKGAFKAGAVVSLGLAVGATGAIAGVEESHKVKKERQQHNLEMAEGGSFDKKDKKRVSLDKFKYEMVSSGDLLKELEKNIREGNSTDLKKELTKKESEQALAILAKIEARKKLNYERKIDLISYSGIQNVEKERKELDILVARAKCQMRKISPLLPEGESFDSYLSKLTETEKIKIIGGENGLDKKDKSFTKFKNKKVASRVIKTVTFGAVLGLIAQEGSALLDEKVQSVFEGVNEQTTEQTPLGRVLDLVMGNKNSYLIDETSQAQVGASEYISNHQEDVTRVIRENWMDNNSEKFDLNELKLKWGGDSGLDNDGNISLHIKDMTESGSFHDNIGIDVPESTGAGTMKVIFSLTNETQGEVFEIPINSDGTITIDPESNIGKLFFDVNKSGQVSFKGRFAEIVKFLGSNQDGTEKVSVISTLVGKGNNNIIENIPSFREIPVETQMPWFLPFLNRKGMGPASFVNEQKPEINTPENVLVTERTGETEEVVPVKKKEEPDKVIEITKEPDPTKKSEPEVVVKITEEPSSGKELEKDEADNQEVEETEPEKNKIKTEKLLEIGTEIVDESGEIIFKIIDIRRRLLRPDLLTLEFIDKQTNQPRSFKRNKRDIIEKLNGGEIKINKLSEKVKIEEDEDTSFFMK